MATENLPPVATAGGPPAATGATVHNVPTEAAVFDQEFMDNCGLDVEDGDEYMLVQKWGTIQLTCSASFANLKPQKRKRPSSGSQIHCWNAWLGK